MAGKRRQRSNTQKEERHKKNVFGVFTFIGPPWHWLGRLIYLFQVVEVFQSTPTNGAFSRSVGRSVDGFQWVGQNAAGRRGLAAARGIQESRWNPVSYPFLFAPQHSALLGVLPCFCHVSRGDGKQARTLVPRVLYPAVLLDPAGPQCFRTFPRTDRLGSPTSSHVCQFTEVDHDRQVSPNDTESLGLRRPQAC